MSKLFRSLAVVAAVALPVSAFGAEPAPVRLTLSQVMNLAASHAPEARLAAGRVAEEEAKLSSAEVRTRENPRFESAVGPRTGSESSVDVELGLEVPVEFGLRKKRVALARAGIERERQVAENARREAVTAAAAAYLAVLQAEERLLLMQERKKVDEELLTIANERFASGDAPKFEVNLAKGELARAASEIASVRGQVAAARGALAQRLGFPSADAIEVAGDLKDRTVFDSTRAQEASGERADLRAALADVEASKRGVELARAEQRPDWALRLNYRREGDENVATAGVSVTLPFFNRNHGALREARAAENRALVGVETRKAAISAEIEAARRAYDAAVEAVRGMEGEALPLQRETESMAAESYRSGKIPLAALLQVRRDALETRKEYLERLYEASAAGVELVSAVGGP